MCIRDRTNHKPTPAHMYLTRLKTNMADDECTARHSKYIPSDVKQHLECILVRCKIYSYVIKLYKVYKIITLRRNGLLLAVCLCPLVKPTQTTAR